MFASVPGRLALPFLMAILAHQVPAAGAQEQSSTATGKTPLEANWASTCSSPSRKQFLSCSLEQRVVLRESGQQLARIAVQTAGPEPRTPGILIHLPLGLSIAAGVSLAIDEAAPVPLPIQTCDGGGCYAGSNVSAELLASLQRGTDLKVTFQDLKGKPITVPFKLDGFTAAFAAIK